MSSLWNSRKFSEVLFNRYLGIIVDPIKNAANPISNVMTRLDEGAFIDNNKNNENRKRTISGLKI